MEYLPGPGTNIGIMLLVVSYEVMAKTIFDPIVATIIKLLKKQIRKINDTVRIMFLVGGFGLNPYLQHKIKEAFKIEEDGVITGYKCGDLLADDYGNLATMRGALYYGFDLSRRPIQINAIPNQSFHSITPNFNYKDYEFLICIGLFHMSLCRKCGHRLMQFIRFQKRRNRVLMYWLPF